MKKILNILLLVTSLNVFAQEVKTTRTGGYFYCQCSDGHTTIKRNTYTSRKRYSQVRALDTTFNKIIELPIRKNNLFKE